MIITKKKNLSLKIQQILREKILSGVYAPGTPLPSNAELQEEFGVSLITANRAMCALADAGLIIRKQGQGSYVNGLISSKRRCRIGIIGSVPLSRSSACNIPMANMMLSEISKLHTLGHETTFIDYRTCCCLEKLQQAVKTLDGLMICRTFLDPLTCRNFLSLPHPKLVINGESILEEPFNQVVTDNYTGHAQAVEETRKYDFSRIFIVHEAHSIGKLRTEAFEQQLIQQGYDANRIVKIGLSDVVIQGGISAYRCARELSGKAAESLIYSTSDPASFSMLEAFREKDLEAGRDFQLLSYDNLEDEGYLPWGTPCLTTIDDKKNFSAQKNVEILLDLINNPTDCISILRIPTSLVIRKTAFNQ